MDITTELSFDLDLSEFAQQVADCFTNREIAEHVEVDHDSIADSLDLSDIATYIEVDYDELANNMFERESMMDCIVSMFCVKSVYDHPTYAKLIEKIVGDVCVSIDADKLVDSPVWYVRVGDYVRKGFERLAFKKFDSEYEHGRVMDDRADTHRLEK